MGLTYHYSFQAPKKSLATELEMFLKTVERQTQQMGFQTTFVLNGGFASEEQKQFARRITTGLFMKDKRLKGVTLLDVSKVWSYDPKEGSCRVIPEHGVLLIVDDEQQKESIFGFLWYPEQLNDLNGKFITNIPHPGGWFFRNFINSPDPRYRRIVKSFADAGFLKEEVDEYNR